LIPALAVAQAPPAPEASADQGAPEAAPPPPPGPDVRTFTWTMDDGPELAMLGDMDLDLDLGPDMEVAPLPDMGPGMGMGMGPGPDMGFFVARHPGPDMGLGRALNDPKMREQLGITPEQETKMRQAMLTFQKAQILARADLQVKRLDLRSLLEADTPDQAAVDKSLREASDAQYKLQKAAIDHQLAMRSMLTAEQREKLKKMRAESPRPRPVVVRGAARMRPDGNGNVMYMRAPRVEKRVIVRSDDDVTPPPPPARPEEPKQ